MIAWGGEDGGGGRGGGLGAGRGGFGLPAITSSACGDFNDMDFAFNHEICDEVNNDGDEDDEEEDGDDGDED